MLKKLALAAAAAAATLAAASNASATVYNFVIFKNNSSVTFNRTSESLYNGNWVTSQPSSNPSGGTKSGYYSADNRVYTSSPSGWSAVGYDANCSFWSYAQLNGFGNMQFYSGSSKSGANSGSLVCSTSTPGSNTTGQYDFNYAVSGI